MLRQVLLCVLIVLCAPNFAQAQRPRRSRPPEERTFGGEDRMKRRVPLPREVLQILSRDEDVRERCLGQNGPGRLEGSSFQASRISLNDKGALGLIVDSLPLSQCYVGGANTNRFWIFYRTPQGYRLVFDAHGHEVDILRTKTNGFYDIRTGYVIGPDVWFELYTFDGTQYKESRSWKEAIKGE